MSVSLDSSGATRVSWSTVPASGGRAWVSRSAMDAVPESSAVDGVPDGVTVAPTGR